MTRPALTLADLDRLVHGWIPRLERGEALSPADYLELGRLWNTIEAHRGLKNEPARARFLELVVNEMPRMAAALHMGPGRGFSLESTEHDFVVGGILDQRHQYDLIDLDPPS